MNICIACGARPNFVKVAPILHALSTPRFQHISSTLVYAGRPDDPTLEASLFSDLGIAPPDVYLGVADESPNLLCSAVMQRFDDYLTTHPTDVVIVVDDLTSTMAVAIATKKRGLKLAHLVAGTRSFDIHMPKEINRLVIDGLSDYLFTAGQGSESNVNREGGEMAHVYMVGNILMDTLRQRLPDLRRPALADQMGLEPGRYLLFTLNRKALLADTAQLARLLQPLDRVAQTMPVVAPLRPAAAAQVAPLMPSVSLVEPMPYLEFGWLAAHAAGIVTDSGNVAEEATFNGVPCITLNSYTEHIETVLKGSNELVGEDPERLADALRRLVDGQWKSCSLPDRWDGRTAERILHILTEAQ